MSLSVFSAWQSRYEHISRADGTLPYYGATRSGFDVVRIQGSHHFLRHPDGRCTVVPIHRSETIGLGLLAKILRGCEIDRARVEADL